MEIGSCHTTARTRNSSGIIKQADTPICYKTNKDTYSTYGCKYPEGLNMFFFKEPIKFH